MTTNIRLHADGSKIRITTSVYAMVVQSIQGSEIINYHPNGTAEVDVPWTLPHMELLSIVSAPAISPLFLDFDFPGKFRPYKHQVAITEFLTRNPRAFCFADMGTGKTMSAIWAAEYLMRQGVVSKVLIVCPKTIMHSAWGDDIMATTIGRSFAVLHGSADKRRQLVAQDVPYHIINFDGVEVILDELIARQYDLVIVDESTAYKNASTKRWKALAKLITPTTRAWGLTGTPTPQGPMDAHGQAKLLVPSRLPKTKRMFEDRVMYVINAAKHIKKPKPGWQDSVNEVLSPAIRVRKEDCLDLPPVVSMFRDVGSTRSQEQMVKELRNNFLVEVGAENEYKVLAESAAILHNKLRQVYAGAVYDSEGNGLEIDNSDRLAEVLTIIEQTKAQGDSSIANGKPHSKTLVFVPFKAALRVVERAISKKYTVRVIDGGVSVNDRRHILRLFQETDEPEVLVAIPEAFSHGVTATAASTIIWFTVPSRTETYLQACERIPRPGQTQSMNVIHLYGSAHERKMYENLLNNKQSQEVLLGMYKQFLKGH